MAAAFARPSEGPRAQRAALALAVLFALSVLWASGPDPASAKRRRSGKATRFRAALLVEAGTGRVLRAHNPRLPLIPASLVKMMVTLITLERIQEKNIHLDDFITVSRQASRMGGQQVYLAQGERFRLEDLLKAVVISSANDAAYAVAEHVAGDAEVFVELMNERAQQLGMTDTRFVNVHGLPPDRGQPPNRMSARDAAALARELLKHPVVTRWSRIKTAPFRKGKFILTNTNRLIGRFPGLDGLKTGSYQQAGYSIVATAKRKGLRLVAVVLASDHPRRRFAEAKRLLAWGFTRYRWYEPPQNGPRRRHKVKVLKGSKGEVRLRARGKFRALIRRGEEKWIVAKAQIPASIPAPVRAGQPVGRILYQLRDRKLGEVALVAAEAVERRSFFQTLIHLFR